MDFLPALSDACDHMSPLIPVLHLVPPRLHDEDPVMQGTLLHLHHQQLQTRMEAQPTPMRSLIPTRAAASRTTAPCLPTQSGSKSGDSGSDDSDTVCVVSSGLRRYATTRPSKNKSRKIGPYIDSQAFSQSTSKFDIAPFSLQSSFYESDDSDTVSVSDGNLRRVFAAVPSANKLPPRRVCFAD